MLFLFLFGMYVFMLARQRIALARGSSVAGDGEASGRITPGSLRKIGFDYNSPDNADNSTV